MLFLLDKYCVGDAFYHELLLAFDGLPRFYLVTHSRDDLNKLCHIDPLQGKYIGAKISVQEHIQDYLNQNPSYHINYDKIKVKINGDGEELPEIPILFFFPFPYYKLRSLSCQQKEIGQVQL